MSGVFLNPAGDIPAYQSAWTLEYLAVCHGWEPSELNDDASRTISALGYQPLSVAEENRKYPSDAEVLVFLSQGDLGRGFTPSLAALEGKWFLKNSAVCKGRIGETEELLAFKGSKFFGYESDCTIRGVKVLNKTLKLVMECASEGEVSQETEQIEFLNEKQIKRSMQDGKKRYSFTHNRCP